MLSSVMLIKENGECFQQPRANVFVGGVIQVNSCFIIQLTYIP